jgi:hypothetical protein
MKGKAANPVQGCQPRARRPTKSKAGNRRARLPTAGKTANVYVLETRLLNQIVKDL